MIIFQNTSINVVFINTQCTYLKKIVCDLISSEFSKGNVDQYHINTEPKTQTYVNNFIDINNNIKSYNASINSNNIIVLSDPLNDELAINSTLSISDSIDEFLLNIKNDIVVL